MSDPDSLQPSARLPDNIPSLALPCLAPEEPYWFVRDEALQNLWSFSLDTALEVARAFYAGETLPPPFDASELEEELAVQFWRTLNLRSGAMPPSPEARRIGVLYGIWQVLERVRKDVPAPEVVSYLSVALRPVIRMEAGVLTVEVCAALYDLDRGVWTPNLTKPQMHALRNTLAQALAHLPPDEMGAFWQNLQSENPAIRSAMLVGLEFLTSAHAVPHLLRGLEQSRDHAIRAAIVDRLELIGDLRAIPLLTRLRRETAFNDWTLSRQIERALRAIERQNLGQQHRTLLRPVERPEHEEEDLLRPIADAPENARAHSEEASALLRPIAKSESGPENASSEEAP